MLCYRCYPNNKSTNFACMYISKFLEMKNEASEPDIKIVDLMEKCLLMIVKLFP